MHVAATLSARRCSLEAELLAVRRQATRRLVLSLAKIGRAFNAGEVLRHAALVSPTLQDCLTALDITSAHKLGKLFQRLAWRDLGGLSVERIGSDSAGAIYIVRVLDTPTPSLSSRPPDRVGCKA